MKKMFLLAGILCLGMGAFAAGTATGDAPEVEVKVTAEVVEPLTLETTDLDFGRLIKPSSGSKDTYKPEKEGSIKINGNNDSKIKLSFKKEAGTYKNYSDFKNDTMDLNHDSLGEHIVYTPKILKGDGEINDDSIGLTSAGEVELKVSGSVNVSSDTKVGKYTGTFTVKVQYE